MSDVQRFNDQVQRAGKDGFDAAVSSFGEANKGFQAIAAEIAAYSKKSFEDATRAFEPLHLPRLGLGSGTRLREACGINCGD